jgi:hypothetical protein
MMKMLIIFDEDKIAREGKYNIDKINDYLATSFAKRGMAKDRNNWFINGNFKTCGSLIIKLSHADWFIDNIQEWLWYDSDDSSTEDLKAHYCSENINA